MAYVRYVLFPLVVGAVFFPQRCSRKHTVFLRTPQSCVETRVLRTLLRLRRRMKKAFTGTLQTFLRQARRFSITKKEEALGVSSLTKKNV